MVVDAEQCQIKYDVIEIPLVDWRTEGRSSIHNLGQVFSSDVVI